MKLKEEDFYCMLVDYAERNRKIPDVLHAPVSQILSMDGWACYSCRALHTAVGKIWIHVDHDTELPYFTKTEVML
jgi:hypothetical protein